MSNPVHQTFYAEFTDDPSSWPSNRPSFDVQKFNQELERRTGCIGTVPRFRLRWAGELDEYILEEGYRTKGYQWMENGEMRFVSALNGDFETPDGAIISPVFEDVKVFTPRWVIEEYDGEFLYKKAWFIELVEKIKEEYGRIDLLSHYRQPSERDIQMCEQLAYLRKTLTPADIAKGIAELNEIKVKEKAERKAEMIDDMAEDVAKALSDPAPNTIYSIPSVTGPERVRQIIQDGKL